MAELEAYSGDVAEQVMNGTWRPHSGTLADTASLHSSSFEPGVPYPYEPPVDDTSSAADEKYPSRATHASAASTQPPPWPMPPAGYTRAAPQANAAAEARTGSGSHDTVTGSERPRNDAPASTAEREERARSAPPPRTSGADVVRTSSQRRSVPTRRAMNLVPGAAAARRDESVYSGAAGSDRGSRSFASAVPSLHGDANDAPSLTSQGGPMGRYASSSVGARSARAVPARATPASRVRAPRGAPGATPAAASATSPELTQALEAIQASLAALTERLDRAESNLTGQRAPAASEARVAMQALLRSVAHATHDVRLFLGVGGAQPDDAVAPSYEAWRARRASWRNGPGGWLWAWLQSPFQFAWVAAGLLARVLLDMTALALFLSLVVAALRRLSGRGDPWIALRLLQRVGVRLSALSTAANRRAATRALLASTVAGGVAMQSARGGAL